MFISLILLIYKSVNLPRLRVLKYIHSFIQLWPSFYNLSVLSSLSLLSTLSVLSFFSFCPFYSFCPSSFSLSFPLCLTFFLLFLSFRLIYWIGVSKSLIRAWSIMPVIQYSLSVLLSFLLFLSFRLFYWIGVSKVLFERGQLCLILYSLSVLLSFRLFY